MECRIEIRAKISGYFKASVRMSRCFSFAHFEGE
nr:MAG TPA: hypothetical protein [Caudoviricetes sp.]